MSPRSPASVAILAVTIVVLALMPAPAAAQGAANAKTSAPAKNWTPPRTPDGQPDLQGVWNFATVTPLERPKEFANKPVLTEEEAAAYEKREVTRMNVDLNKREGDPGTYNEFWWEHGSKIQADRRTSLVIDPPDGRIPSLTPEAQKRVAAANTAAIRARRDRPDSIEDFTIRDRCILYRPIPATPTQNNNNFRIVQSRNSVAILQEEIHETRIIPLDGRPHIGSSIRQWNGDSRGHWEGDTLVVETTNFTDQTDFHGANVNLRVVERFTRAAPDRIDVEFTVTDPTTWTRPWTAKVNYWKNEDGLFEYACHEGDYAVKHILLNARAADAAKKESAK